MSAPLPPGPYLVLGCGRAGMAAAGALAASADPREVKVWDAHDGPWTRARREQLAVLGVAVQLGPWTSQHLDRGPRTVIKSPGIAHDSEPVQAALARAIPVIDELDLGQRLSRRILVAVTGTDGKSTVCALIARVLGEHTPVAGNTEFGPALSALGPTGGTVVVEASSYQLQFCERPFAELAVLTNLTVEHLHRHGTMADYGRAKRKLFLAGGAAVPRAVLNGDADFGRALAAELRARGGRVACFGFSEDCDYRVLDCDWDSASAVTRIATPSDDVVLTTRLPGRHNAENLAAALAASDLLGIGRGRSLAALQGAAGVPGRWETIDAGQPFDAIVDFAHTPAALRTLLETARHTVARRSRAQVHLVLCAGGANNPGKRAPFGRIASELADRVVLTEGNRRGESTEEVIAAVLEGVGDAEVPVEIIPDRRAAIRHSLRCARPQDLVLVMGRGSMPRLLANSSGEGERFDDRAVVREELLALAADLQLSA